MLVGYIIDYNHKKIRFFGNCKYNFENFKINGSLELKRQKRVSNKSSLLTFIAPLRDDNEHAPSPREVCT
jgi:hypothetical protein